MSYTRLGATTLTGDTNAHTKGSYTQLHASIPFMTRRVRFLLTVVSTGTLRRYLMDLAVDIGGTKQIVLADIPFGFGGTGTFGFSALYDFPLILPRGANVHARIQSSATTGDQMSVAMWGDPGDSAQYATYRFVTYGTDAASSRGTQITLGNGSKGSYAQLTAGSDRRHQWVGLAVTSISGLVVFNQNADLDLAIGAGGSEQIILPDARVLRHASLDICLPQPIYDLSAPLGIPAGTRFACRGEQPNGTEVLDVHLFGG